jgi:hypothetical protein
MKQISIIASLFLLCFALQAQIKLPAPSPTQTIKQDFALGSIEVRYSRPAAKGRKVFGDLVPFTKLWRTGANSATIVRFNDVVEIKGKRIDTGSYALYTVPNTDSWEIILNKGTGNWGIDGYKESEDVVRFRIEPVKTKNNLENFTIQFADIKPESCELQLMWEKTLVSIPVIANIKERIRGQVEKALKTDTKPNWQAAQFYFEYDKNTGKALEYIKKAVEDSPDAYWVWIYKAKIEKEAGDKVAAMASSKKSLELAKAAHNDDYVKMNSELQKTLH